MQKSQKGIKDVEYYLSLECFEKICMESITIEGDLFRNNIVKYKNYIINNK